MKLTANIWFEKLHRYVYDNSFTQNNKRFTKSEKIKIYLAVKLYKFLSPYFIGWRLSLRINFPDSKKYIRYEPKTLDLMKYEYNNLSRDLKLKYLEHKILK